MDVDQMIEAFDIHYDRISSFSSPGYEVDEKLIFLNYAQGQFVKDRMFGEKFQPPAFEDNSKRVADLRTLVKPASLFFNSIDPVGAALYTLPTDFLYPINANALCTRTNYPIVTSGEYFDCQTIKTEHKLKFINSTTNRTHFIKPKVVIAGTFLELIVDRFTTVTEVLLNYIVEPTELIEGGTCDLPEHTHDEILDIAVMVALQTIQDPRLITKIQTEMAKTK
jgi:hypothetical protein